MKTSTLFLQTFKFSTQKSNSYDITHSPSFNTKQYSTSSLKNKQSLSSYSVNSILYNQRNNPLFVYQKTKQVCNTIKTLFNNIPKYPEENINQLKRLFQKVHLSSFSSWRLLKQTANSLNIMLNQNLNPQSLSKMQLLSLCQVLYQLNYELDQEKDHNFITTQLVPNFYHSEVCRLKSQHDIQLLSVLSSHSSLLLLFNNHKNILQTNLLQKIKNQSQMTKNSQYFLQNFIKKGLYRNFWNPTFLHQLIQLIQQDQNITKKFKSLINALYFNANSTQLNLTDQWKIKDTTIYPTANIVTEQKIFNVLKQLDYPVQTNQAIFQYQVDYKLASNCIVQYHGIHHYQINTNAPAQTMKSKWKVECLRRKGYRVFVIPFYNWNHLETIYQKKKWLIENMETSLF